jgi:hypothetical protein
VQLEDRPERSRPASNLEHLERDRVDVNVEQAGPARGLEQPHHRRAPVVARWQVEHGVDALGRGAPSSSDDFGDGVGRAGRPHRRRPGEKRLNLRLVDEDAAADPERDQRNRYTEP